MRRQKQSKESWSHTSVPRKESSTWIWPSIVVSSISLPSLLNFTTFASERSPPTENISKGPYATKILSKSEKDNWIHQSCRKIAFVGNYIPFRTYGYQTFLCSHQRRLRKLTLGHRMLQQAFLGLVRDPVVNPNGQWETDIATGICTYVVKTTWHFSTLWSQSKTVRSREPEMKHSPPEHKLSETTLRRAIMG